MNRPQRMNRQAITIFGTALLLSQAASAQEPPTTTASASPSVAAEETEETGWEISLSAYTYIVPDDREYVQPTITLDRGWLHLEGRYNYEALDTGSLWFGYNLGGGDDFWWEFTPMIGGVFGETTGIAPGYKGSLGWWKFELYTEGEYVFDTNNTSDNFFYSWSELSIAPWDWLRVGLVGQRTRLYESDREYSGGLLLGVTIKRLDLTTYVFDLDENEPLVVIGLGFGF